MDKQDLLEAFEVVELEERVEFARCCGPECPELIPECNIP